MSQTRREVVFSARDEGISSMMSRLESQSKDLSRGLLQDSMAQTNSANQALQNYEKQIKLIERKNRLESQARRSELEAQRDQALGGQTTSQGRKAVRSEYAEKFSALGSETKEDKMQTSILRDILQSIKDGTDDVVDSNFDSSNLSDDKLKEMVRSGDPQQKSALHELRARQAKGGSAGGGGIGGIKGALGAAGVLTLLAGMAKLYMGGMSSVVEREGDISEYSALSGNSNTFLSRYSGMGRGSGLINSYLYGNSGGPQSIGYDQSTYFQNLASGTRAYGGASGLAGDASRTMGSLALQRGTGMSEGTVRVLEKLTRTLDSDKVATDTTNRIFSAMYNTGAFGTTNGDMTRMDELASTYAQFQESQFSRTGFIGGGNEWLNMRRQLEGQGGKFSRDDYAASTLESLSGGLAGGGGPEVNAIKMDILRKMNPKMGYFELQAEMEKGISSKGFASGAMDFVKGTGGDLNAQAILMNQLTGGQMRKSDIISILRGGVEFGDLDAQSQTKDIQLMQKAKASSGETDTFLKNINSDWETIKQAFFNLANGDINVGPSMAPLIETLKLLYK